MSDDKAGNSVISLAEQALVAQGASENRLIRRAVSDALVPMHELSSSLRAVLRRVGDWEFHEEDYRQLEIWSDALDMETLDEVVDYISEAFAKHRFTNHRRHRGGSRARHTRVVDL